MNLGCYDLYHCDLLKFLLGLHCQSLTVINPCVMNCTQKDSLKGEIYIAFNACHLAVTISLPERPGYKWEPLVDTSKYTPFDFLSTDLPGRETAIKHYAHFLDANLYPMLSYSSIILLLAPHEQDV